MTARFIQRSCSEGTLQTNPNFKGSVSGANETWQVCTNLLTHGCVSIGAAGWGKNPCEVQKKQGKEFGAQFMGGFSAR